MIFIKSIGLANILYCLEVFLFKIIKYKETDLNALFIILNALEVVCSEFIVIIMYPYKTKIFVACTMYVQSTYYDVHVV